MKPDKFWGWHFNCRNSLSRAVANFLVVEIFKWKMNAFLKEIRLLNNSGFFENCILSLCHINWSQQSLLGLQLWITKGVFCRFFKTLEFLWQVSAFRGLRTVTKILKCYWYNQLFGEFRSVIYFECLIHFEGSVAWRIVKGRRGEHISEERRPPGFFLLGAHVCKGDDGKVLKLYMPLTLYKLLQTQGLVVAWRSSFWNGKVLWNSTFSLTSLCFVTEQGPQSSAEQSVLRCYQTHTQMHQKGCSVFHPPFFYSLMAPWFLAELFILRSD